MHFDSVGAASACIPVDLTGAAAIGFFNICFLAAASRSHI